MQDFPDISEAEWRERVEEELGDAGLESLTTETLEGLRLTPLYPASAPDVAGFPGAWPYVRGSRPAPGQPPWVVCQAIADPDLDVAVAQVEADRRAGVRGLWLRLDRCARLGLDPAQDSAGEACGVEGLAAYDAGDLAALLEAAGAGSLSVRLEPGGNALPATAVLVAALERAERNPDEVTVHLGADPLGALAGDGGLPAAAAVLGREAALLASRRDTPFGWFRSIGVSALPYSRAGAHTVQELALAMAAAIQYLRWLEEHGVEPAAAVGQIDFVFEGGRDLLVDLCKLRAARALWARVQVACGVAPTRPWIHSATARRTLTRADPWTNMLRVTVQCVAAILGGADSITTLAFDARLGRASDLGRRVARNTQSILAEESGLGRTLDAAGGAHAVEALTEDLARRAWELLQDLEGSGGLLACLQDGQVHTMLEETVKQRAARVAAGKDPVLGVSAHPPGEDNAPEHDAPEPAAIRERVAARLEERRGSSVAPELEALSAAGSDQEDGARLWDALVDAARDGATLAELSATVRSGKSLKAAALPRNTDEEIVLSLDLEERA